MSTVTPETESGIERLMRRREAIAEARTEARTKAEMLVLVLEARGLTPSPSQRERIASCTDPEVLTAWVTRAATATAATEVFGDD
jgi:hypothetical protein